MMHKAALTAVKPIAWLVAAALLLGPDLALAFGSCPPDGDETMWPTPSIDEKCGSYDTCTILQQANRTQEAVACTQKIDRCAYSLHQANERAETHNAALEDCRANLPAQPKPVRPNASKPGKHK